MLILEIVDDNLFDILPVDVLDIGRASGEVIEYVANFQVVQVKVSLVKFSIGFLKQIYPDFIGSTRGELWLC